MNPALQAKACRFVVVEDDQMFCDLLSGKLRDHFTPAALHSFYSGRKALAYCRREPVDVVVTDLGLTDMDGREVIREVRAREPKPRIIVLTSRIDASLPAELIALGVGGFVDKAVPLEHAMRAVQRVLAGGMYFFADVLPAGASSPAPAAPAGTLAGPGTEVLTEREREVVRLVATGLSSKDISRRLDLSTRTVENHRANAMQKIGVRDTVGLVRWCIARGLG